MSFESHNAAVLADLQCKIDNLDLYSYRTDDHADRLPVNHWRPWFLIPKEGFFGQIAYSIWFSEAVLFSRIGAMIRS